MTDDFDAATYDMLAERQGTLAHGMVWIRARNRQTGAEEGVGFWQGDDHRSFTIGGEVRLYFGAGAVIAIPPVHAVVGLQVRQHRVELPPFLPEVRQALRVYDPREARVEIHGVALDPATGEPAGPPRRYVKGRLMEANEILGPKGAASSVELVIASAARSLTRSRPLLRTNAALVARRPGERGREYSDVAGEWHVPWGVKE